MRDVHVHIRHRGPAGYTRGHFEDIAAAALNAGLDEIYLLEHTHQFTEFENIYAPVVAYNNFQRDWIGRKMDGSIERYLEFISAMKTGGAFEAEGAFGAYNVTESGGALKVSQSGGALKVARSGGAPAPRAVKVRFGLEACYLAETEDRLAALLDEYGDDFDFLTGSVHWIGGWGFDFAAQKEIWLSQGVDAVYRSYYGIMLGLCESGLFTGLAHPDSIKCFGYAPSCDMSDQYRELAALLAKYGMYAENSGGLRLNFSPDLELGLNSRLLRILRETGVTIYTASDAHKAADAGANIRELEKMLE